MLWDSDVQNFLEGEESQNTKGKNLSCILNGFGNGISGKNKNWQFKELPQCDFGGVPENISSDGKEKLNNWGSWKLKVMLVVCVCKDSTCFLSWAL